jgi:hypothetical protein
MTAAGVGMSLLITAPIVAFGAAALLAANNVQKAYAIIIAGTGATGDKLSGLEKQFDTLAANVPNSFTDTATVLTTVNNKLAEGGYAIAAISKSILDVSRMTGESASSLASDFTAAITQWGVSASATKGFMDEVYTAAQAARVPVTTMLTELDTYGPVIKNAGLSLQEAIPILADIESKGEDATRTFQGMAYGWANVAKMIASPSKATQGAIDDITKSAKDAGIQLTSTGNDMQAVFYGIKAGIISDADAANIFGSRFASNITGIIKDGGITATQFVQLMQGMGISIDDVGKRTITFAQALDEMKNELEIAISPIGFQMLTAFQQLMPVISGAITLFGDLAGAFGALPTPVADVIFAIVGIAAAIGPTLVLVGGLVSAFGTIVTAVGSLVTAIPTLIAIFVLLAPVLVIATVAVAALTAVIAPLAAALVLAYDSSAKFRGALSDLEGALGTAAGAFDTLGSHISTGLSYIMSGNYKAGFAAFTTGFTDMWSTITEINWLGLGENLVTQIASGISTNMPKVVAALQDFVTGADKTWNTVSKDFTTWVSSVNWTADAKKIPAAIILGLQDLQKDLTPIWNTIETSFTTWENSVPWATLASQIPTDISNAIKLSMATIGPVWDYIQISLMNWIQGVDWTSIGNQLGVSLRYAIQVALTSLVGGLSDLIPTALITKGQPNLVGVGITAAQNFISGFQSGLGDLWKLIMDSLDPLAGKLADYMEHDVDWAGIGNAIGSILGSMIATVMGVDVGGALGGGSGGPTAFQQESAAQAGAEATGAGPTGTETSGWSKLQTAGQDAGDALVTGFVKGAQDAMANINWGDIIKNAILGSIQGGGSGGAGNPAATPNPAETGQPGLAKDAFNWLMAEPGNIASGLTGPGGFFDLSGLPSLGDIGGTLFGKGGAFDLSGLPSIPGLGKFGAGLSQEGNNVVSGWGGVLGGLENPGGIGNGPMPGVIDLPQKIMGGINALGKVDFGKLTKGGIFDLDSGPLAPLAKADYGTEFGKLTKGGIFDLDNGPLAPLAKTNWGAIPSQVSGALSSAGATVTGAAKSIWDFITGAPKEIWTWITGTAHDIWTYITGAAHDIWSYITGGAHDIWSYITGGARDIWTYITGGARDIWSYITGGARDIWTYITGAARDIWTYITGGAHDIWSYITGGAHDIWATYITGGAKDLWHDFVSGWPVSILSLITGANITQFITGSIPSASTPVDQPQQGAAGTPNTMLSTGPGAMPWPGPATTPMPAQTGAIFNARSGGVHALLAEAGEAEMVVPQNRWGESWTHLIQTLPHFGAGAIVGNVRMPSLPQFDTGILSGISDQIMSLVQNATSQNGPTYQVNATIDAEAIKREIMQAILELEQFHHLGNSGY